MVHHMHEPGIEGGGTVTRYQHKYLYGRMDTKSWAVKDGDKHHDASLDCIFFFKVIISFQTHMEVDDDDDDDDTHH